MSESTAERGDIHSRRDGGLWLIYAPDVARLGRKRDGD
jgi:hypothetical protein